MLTTGCKTFLYAGIGLLLSAWIYGWTTGSDYPLGPVSLGYKGGVGEHVGYVALMSLSILCFAMSILLVSVRDLDRADDAPAAIASTAEVAPTSWLPLGGAAAMGVIVVGLVYGSVVVALGVAGLVVVSLRWIHATMNDSASSQPTFLDEGVVHEPAAVGAPVATGLLTPRILRVGLVAAAAAIVVGFLSTLLAMSRNDPGVVVWLIVVAAGVVVRAWLEWLGRRVPVARSS